MIEKLKFVLGRVENILGKGENAGYQHFLLFPECFKKSFPQGSLKVGNVWYKAECHRKYLSGLLYSVVTIEIKM